MRIASRLLTGLTVLALTAPFAAAQTTGTITVTGTTPEAFALTNTSDGALASTIALGVLTPTSGVTIADLTTGTPVDVRLRSNKAYKLTATAGALAVIGAGATDGGEAIALTDIGFGILLITAPGANGATGRSDTIVAGYDVSGGWPTPTNGLTPVFTKTLNDITSATQVLSGTRVSAKGNIATNNNYLTVRFGVATLPQFFTPNTGFSSIVTLTLASQ